jgi:hypothetical protein
MEPVDPNIVKMLTYKRQAYRPVVKIPGGKDFVAPREFERYDDAQRWAAGFVSVGGTFIKAGTSVQIGDTVLAVVPMTNGGNRLQFLGRRRTLSPVAKDSK